MKNQKDKRIKRGYMVTAVTLACIILLAPCAAAEDDPLTVINGLSDFLFAAIRAIGLITLGFGILQFGLSMKSHDASQRATSLLTILGGIIITFAKEILDLIMGG